MCLCVYVCVCVCVSVCLLTCSLGECFVSLLVEPIAGKNVSPSDKQLIFEKCLSCREIIVLSLIDRSPS